MSKSPTGLEVVEVHWLDAKTAAGGWEDNATMFPLEPMQCVSVGFVAAEDDQALVLVQTLGEDAMQGRIVIPRGAVVKMRPLAVKGRRKR